MAFDRGAEWDRVNMVFAPMIMTALDNRYVNAAGDSMPGPLTLTGAATQLTVAPSAATTGEIDIRVPNAQNGIIAFKTGLLNRWQIFKNNVSESGGNVGSDFAIGRYNDAGANIDYPFAISRSTGNVGISSALNVVGTATVGGDLDHNGTNVGFYGVAPVARPATYTQTFATASRTHAARTTATLTDSSGGTATTTIAAVPGTYSQTNTRDAYASMTSQINKLIADLASTGAVLNQVIDDLQANGLLQ